MDLKEYLTISGQPGLFKMISQGKNAVIVENLQTGKRMPAYASHRISGLEDIALFTDGEDLPLKDVFIRLFEHLDGKKVENPKKMSGEELKTFFGDIIPEYDRERVYVSDIKKAVLWYNELSELGLIELPEEESEEKSEEESDEKSDEKSVESPEEKAAEEEADEPSDK
ncbi:MAG: DUF5606 domain-containing protein [Bacteroidetes bacterium]|jgi:hypothetical protein|nr:DUF5606 domain-containing protein [Bacteroidota bacterium]MBT3749526.1 DUF5606 domain-containing protein [Bacteroidota bacterium]MBT4398540.1 DUF5606 domain-containing protein [Bacteroidota bacterium]MBT4411926.1 DUF5606 domain-containing protein [Bacteroidota bacterium]MBT7093484.1 DUF5606 domain-containing protein [Bacteroidota bacterium]